MIKGITKIQLFDAATGEETKSAVSENMVTNAITNILNPDMSIMMSNDFLASLCISATPFCDKLLSGVMLFDSLIEEDADNVFIPAGASEVGHAGSPYTGTSIYRGSLNENESGAIEGGRRYVWDFASDKANGTINCISLTSRTGGNMGLHASDSNDETLFLSPRNVVNTNYSSSGITLTKGLGSYIGSVERNKHIYGSINGGGITLSVYKQISRTGIKLTDDITSDCADKLVSTDTLTSDYSALPAITLGYVTSDGRLCFLWKSSTEGNVRYVSINLETMTFTSQREITLTGAELTLAYPAFAEVDGFFYIALNATHVGKFTTSGVYVCDYELNAANTYTAEANGMIYFISPSGQITMLNGSGTSTVKRSNIMSSVYTRIVPDVMLKAPYMALTSANVNPSINQNAELYINALYLGTINNLAEPIVKTTNNTMKITYDIVNA